MKKLFGIILFGLVSCKSSTQAPLLNGIIRKTTATAEISSNITVIKKNYYTIVYDLNLKSPLYTYYTLFGENLKHSTSKRTSFHLDLDIPFKYQSGPGEYENSGYDKGHLAPDADFTFNFEAESDAMVYTNCAPQVSQFNRGIWKSIEGYTRMSAESYDSVQVFTGVIYSDKSLRLNSILIPDYFFKIERFNSQTVCFLGKNQLQVSKNIFDLKVPIDSIKVKLNENYEVIKKLN